MVTDQVVQEPLPGSETFPKLGFQGLAVGLVLDCLRDIVTSDRYYWQDSMISMKGIAPSRISLGEPLVKSTIVEAVPVGAGPQEII
jgi:hypothetical protein